MKVVTPILFSLALSVGMYTGIGSLSSSNESRVLGAAAEVITFPTLTPTPTLTPSPTPTPSPTSRPTPTATPTPLPTPKYTSEQIYQFTNEFGAQYHIDPNIIRHIAICESGFNPNSKTKLFGGMFQYTVDTWKRYRRLMGLDPDPNLRFDGKEAVRTTAYILSLGQSQNWPNCHP